MTFGFPDLHGHDFGDLRGVPSLEEFQQLQEQVAALSEQCSRLAEQMLTEREVGAAVAGGADTPELIAAAIERRAKGLDHDGEWFLASQARLLAKEIRGAAES